MVSKTQYASFVSAINVPSHLICKCLGVRSQRGGRGKSRGFRGALVDIFAFDRALIMRLLMKG